MKMDEVTIIERMPTAEELTVLRLSAGWQNGPLEGYRAGLANTLYGVCAVSKGEVIGTARVVGDGYTVFYIQDVIVHPDYQRQGIGQVMMEKVMEYIDRTACERAVVGLMSAGGKEEFYERFGFIKRPNEKFGSGMTQFWKREEQK
jgi:GNAT superfamily N-acetyltransferase